MPKKERLSSLRSSFEPQIHMASPLPPPDEYWATLGTCSKIRYTSDQVSTEAAGSSDREKHRKGRVSLKGAPGGPKAEWSWYFLA